MVTRRQMLALAGSAPIWMSATTAAAAAGAPKMGGTPSAFGTYRGGRGSAQQFDMVEHCHKIGLAGVQTNPPALDTASIKAFRAKLEKYGMHLICDPRLPAPGGDTTEFENQVKAFKEAGASSLHVALTGRRYEDFDALAPFQKLFEGIKASIQAAEPILRKHQIKLGMENHKGYRAAEHAAFLKKLSSEWVGVCYDFGNNLSLSEHPDDTLQTLLPYVVSAHIKDMGLDQYEDGFLLSEVPLGEGVINLKKTVETLRQKDPNMIFNLEMITRDPLTIPVYTAKYWATFDDSYSPLPGRELAKVLDLVRKNKPKKPLQRTTGMSPAETRKAEDDNNAACIAYAKQNLNL